MSDTSSFRFDETALGHLNNRNKFLSLEEWARVAKPPDSFRSVALYDEAALAYAQGNIKDGHPSIAGYTGDVLVPRLVMDFDGKNPGITIDDALENARAFVTDWLERYGPEGVYCWFSGNKGIHVEIEAGRFGGFPPASSPLLMGRLKRLVGNLTRHLDLPTLDMSIYNAGRLWRAENSIHGKSGLYKVPLTLDQFMTLSGEEMRHFARKPRHPRLSSGSEVSPDPTLIETWHLTALEPPPAKPQRPSRPITPPAAPKAAQGQREAALSLLAAHWPGVTERHDAFIALAGGLLRSGWPVEDTVEFLTTLGYMTFAQEEWGRIDSGELFRIAHDTAGKIAGEGPLTGWTRLGEAIGAEHVREVRRLLGISSGYPDDSRRRELEEQNAKLQAEVDALRRANRAASERIADLEDRGGGDCESCEAKDRQIGDYRMMMAVSISRDEAMGELLSTKGSIAPLKAYAVAIPQISRAKEEDKDSQGFSQMFRPQLARVSGTNKNDAGKALRWMQEDGIILDWEKYDDGREYHSKRQKALADEVTMWQKLRDRCKKNNQAFLDRGEKRGRKKAGEAALPRCPNDPKHPLDIICGVCRIPLREDVKPPPTPEPAANKIRTYVQGSLFPEDRTKKEPKDATPPRRPSRDANVRPRDAAGSRAAPRGAGGMGGGGQAGGGGGYRDWRTAGNSGGRR